MMLSKFQIVGLIISFLWLFGIIELVRRKKLMGAYSLVWFFAGICLAVLALWEGLLIRLTHFIGFISPPSTFFALVNIFLALIVLDFSIRLSRLSRQNKEMAQRIALIEIKKMTKG